MNPKKLIVLCAGGTGGHILPAIALSRKLKELGYDFHLFTDKRCEKYITEDLKAISSILNFRLPRKSLKSKLGFYCALMILTIKSFFILAKIRPAAIIGFGGYPSFPPLFASIFLQIPIIIYEQNSYVGKVNRFFVRFAKKIATAYHDTKNLSISGISKSIFVGNIIRDTIKNLPDKRQFSKDGLRILIFGGSQGAKIFSSVVPESIQLLCRANPGIKLHIIQQAQEEDQESIMRVYDSLKITYELASFFTDIEKKYLESDIVISRAGASTIAELKHIAMPAILIPLPSSADNHQLYNAKAMQNQNGAWCFEQDARLSTKISDKLIEIVKNPVILENASSELFKLDRSDGVVNIAKIIKQNILASNV